ncbi:TolC family protein, partial [bacterium]|nr:TolC family protein [candidate division CSSED10-310 bacterium]
QNALIRHRAQIETTEAEMRQLDSVQASYRESLDRYRNGTIDYLPVLTALTQAQRSERALLQSRYELILEHIQLIRALGGDWMERHMDPETRRP